MSDAELAAFTGNYQADSARFMVSKYRFELVLSNGKQSFTLIPLADNSFTIAGAEDKCRLIFGLQSHDAANHLLIVQNSGSTKLNLSRKD